MRRLLGMVWAIGFMLGIVFVLFGIIFIVMLCLFFRPVCASSIRIQSCLALCTGLLFPGFLALRGCSDSLVCVAIAAVTSIVGVNGYDEYCSMNSLEEDVTTLSAATALDMSDSASRLPVLMFLVDTPSKISNYKKRQRYAARGFGHPTLSATSLRINSRRIQGWDQ